MQAIQIERTGGPEVMQVVDIPVGDPGPGQVRVRHSACGVNAIDTFHRRGLFKTQLPIALGVGGAGVVGPVAAAVTHLAIGDRRGYSAGSPGSYAQARVLDAIQVVKLPDEIAFGTAAGMML